MTADLHRLIAELGDAGCEQRDVVIISLLHCALTRTRFT
jgi:hypothetical protein